MVTIDRIEESFAVCEKEDGSMQSYPKELFYPTAEEGGCYREENGGFVLDEEETERIRTEMNVLLEEVLGE